MSKCIYGTPVGGGASPKSYVLEMEDGTQLVGVLVDDVTVMTATDNDVREGLVYASDSGVSTGTKVIPSYNTTEGTQLIPVGSTFMFTPRYPELYDYTKLQAIICPYNISMSNSVSAEKVVINDNVYESFSATSISEIVKDSENKQINFGITNTGDKPYIIRYFTYKEIINMEKSMNYAYNYAEIDPATGMCIQVISTTTNEGGEQGVWVEIPVYDEEYIMKYYINGNWYEDAEGTIPWTSSLI
ncbi:MAG: hypothetical protein IJY67_10965 [Paludibacteraceae bacterium]|nr:hypothetical protein [Paludibacteraceae bacterium]